MWRLRFVDFLVKMWRLNAFWWVILPVPVTLKRFLALELVLTFGILNTLFNFTLEALLHRQKTCWASSGDVLLISDLTRGITGCGAQR